MQLETRVPITFAQINQWNERFWIEQRKLRDERISNETVFTVATNDMLSENARIPIYFQKSLEQALADAAKSFTIFQSSFSRKGGQAPNKNDAFQALVMGIASQNRSITQGQLLREIAKLEGQGVIESIDQEADVKADEPRMIHYIDHNGTPKMASIRGLKDRLLRIKKNLAAR